LLAVKRGVVGMSHVTERWLPIVSDGQGELIAVADSAGELQGTVTGPEYDAGLWNSSGLTAHSHSFNPARWGVSGGIDTISTFRNRQYDPSTGKWLQEDPIGTAGGVNLYQYNGNDPNSFSDPFGDTVVVDKSARSDVASCRSKSVTCAQEFNALAQSSSYFMIRSGALPKSCSARQQKSGCTDPSPIPGHGHGGTIAFNRKDFRGSALSLGVPVNATLVLVHELGHANGCHSEPCAVTVENMARRELGFPVRP
jgi:RHS repeat-associated protein